MKVNLEDFEAISEYYNAINKAKLEDVEIYEDDVKLDISQAVIDDWIDSDLCNVYFIQSRIWEK